jgi:hypothetical protein
MACKARTKGNEMVDCMERIGRMLIELKDKVPHGNFMTTAANLTGIPHRSITRYMEWALKPITTAELRRIDAPEDMMKLAKPASPPPASKLATVAILPASPAPSPRLPQVTVEAEIVETPAPATAPPQAPLETEVEEPPAPAVAPATASPAPSVIETSETTLAQILGLLPRLRPVEITELHRVIESSWMKPQTQTAAP